MSPTSIGPRDERAAEQVGIGGGGRRRRGPPSGSAATTLFAAPWDRLRPPLSIQRPRHTPGKAAGTNQPVMRSRSFNGLAGATAGAPPFRCSSAADFCVGVARKSSCSCERAWSLTAGRPARAAPSMCRAVAEAAAASNTAVRIAMILNPCISGDPFF
jgi:hypothetical protein